MDAPGLGYEEALGGYFAAKAPMREAMLRLDVTALVQDLPEIARAGRRLDDLLRAFQGMWRAAKTPGDVVGHRGLREACEQAEVRRKGLRARLPLLEGKARRMDFTKDTVRAAGLDYRWGVTRRLVSDVCEGLARG
jgi:hypothetical protein